MKKLNIVTISGGTGGFVLLSGLKKYPVNLAAIVSMADDGGSTGVLRDELGVLPPGDVRQCLVALSDSSQTLRNLFNYRFESGGLKGHNFGNLFLSALEKTSDNFLDAVSKAIRILNVRGQVIPATDRAVRLVAKLGDGSVLKGEGKIYTSRNLEKRRVNKIFIEPAVKANKKAIEYIRKADVVVIGPGDHFSSIAPVLLVGGIRNAICRSKALVIYNVNLVSKSGQTEKFNADDYANAIDNFLGKRRTDVIFVNNKKPPQRVVDQYLRKGERLVVFGKNDRKKRGYKVFSANLLSSRLAKLSATDKIASSRSLIRHDSDKLARAIMLVSQLGEYGKTIKRIA